MTSLEVMLETIDELQHILNDKGVVKWFNIPMQKLNWATPLETLIEGDCDTVLELAKSYREVPFYS